MSQPRLPPTHTIFLVFCVRLFLALFTSGFFQPDEYFQALEPAHKAVFGYGHLTWEWAANPPIRSFVYPSLFVPAYALVRGAHLENTKLLIWAPKLVQVIFATMGDVALYYLGSSVLSESHGMVSLFLSLTSPFNTLALTRTLSNSTETSLFILALAFWPLKGFQSRSRTRIALSLAALSCMVRPTSAILWTFLASELIWRWRMSVARVGSLMLDASSVGAIAFIVIVVIDTAYYGALTFTPISFLRTNILSGTARFYGVNTSHYYLTQGLPIILGHILPFTLHGIWMHLNTFSNNSTQVRSSHHALSVLLGLVAWTIVVYSCLAHKEWRFIHPLLPVLHIFAADSLIELWNRDMLKRTKPTTSSALKQTKQLPILSHHLVILLGISLPLNIYILRMHGSAQITAARFLHSLGQEPSRVKSVGVLMPCHSIPWQSYIHLPHLEQDLDGSRLWALGCEPPLGFNSTEFQAYSSQTDVFFEKGGPIAYFQEYFPQTVEPTFPPSPSPYTIPGSRPPESGWNHTWPSHLLMFGALKDQLANAESLMTVGSKLQELGYEVIRHIKNGWEEDERRKGGIIVWEWTGRVL